MYSDSSLSTAPHLVFFQTFSLLWYWWTPILFLPACDPQVHIEETGMIVIVEEPPTSFSPFSLVDCTLLSHFSFNDFVAIAFPHLAMLQ